MQERKAEADRLQMVRTMQDNRERLAARQLALERDKMESDRCDATQCTLRAQRHALAWFYALAIHHSQAMLTQCSGYMLRCVQHVDMACTGPCLQGALAAQLSCKSAEG